VETFAHLLDVAAVEARRRSSDAMRLHLEDDLRDLLAANKVS